MKIRKNYIPSYLFVVFFSLSFFAFFSLHTTFASSISISPSSGIYSVGSTFDASVLLDTKGKSINAMQVFLSFPADKLQVVSPSTGASIVDVWTVPPKFNNTLGTVDLEGGIPGGIITDKGILTTITFRVTNVGDAFIKFLDKSRVFLNDGLATQDLGAMSSATYQLKLPPPQGPIVVSNTDPDQTVWYPDTTAVLNFSNSLPIQGYSYVLSDDPNAIPDNISEGTRSSISYDNLSDGVHYFNIRALRDGVWGGTTHFAIRVDTTPPAQFPIQILPSARTSSDKPVIQFSTTDVSSGIDHYEIKIQPLSSDGTDTASSSDPFFIEAESPFISSPLALGSYNVIIRAYDKATNYREITKRLVITTPLFTIIGDEGLQIDNAFIIPWNYVWFISILLLFILGFAAYKVFYWHKEMHVLTEEKKLPHEVVEKLEELKKYRQKYGAKTLVALFAILSIVSLLFAHSTHADTLTLTPPLITTYSKNISNKEIFYAGGKTDVINEVVILYLQSLSSGETFRELTVSDKDGDWFYRHTTFLDPGDYLMWTQSQEGDQFSPPSPEQKMIVMKTAISFGSNRLSYETIYLFVSIVLLLLVIGLVLWILFHAYHGRKKRRKLEHSVREAEESIQRGFAVLKRDIEAELVVVRKAVMNESLSTEEREKEAQLLSDLNSISKHIGKEIWDIAEGDAL